jgi:diguanylate cyclase (GGDEF)-like protein
MEPTEPDPDSPVEPAPPDLSCESLSALRAMVEEGIEEIVERWMAAVRSDRRVPSSRRLDEAMLRDSVPDVLREILRVLTEPDHQVRAEVVCSADDHGQERAEQRFAIDELVREYQLLRQELFAFLQERFGELRDVTRHDLFLVFRMVGHALDDALRLTAQAYVEAYTEKLRHLSRTDSLTGLLNHRTFYQRLEEEVASAAEHGRSLVVTLVDLDRFKDVNETHGHVYGDRVLRECAAALRESLRAEDVVCRYGGDEMAVIFPRAGLEQVEVLLERVARSFASAAARLEAPADFGFSHGSAFYPVDGAGADELVLIADQRLRHAKRRKDGELPPRGNGGGLAGHSPAESQKSSS